MPSSASSRLYEWYVFVDAARRSAIVSNLQVDAARRPLLVEPGASRLDFHIFDEDPILSGESHACEWRVTDIKRRKVDVFPFEVWLQLVDGVTNVREVHEFRIDRAIRRVAQPFDAIRVVSRVRDPAFGWRDMVLFWLWLVCAQADVMEPFLWFLLRRH